MRRQSESEKEGLRWKQTLTFNGLYWSKNGWEWGGRASTADSGERERVKEEARGGLSGEREWRGRQRKVACREG